MLARIVRFEVARNKAFVILGDVNSHSVTADFRGNEEHGVAVRVEFCLARIRCRTALVVFVEQIVVAINEAIYERALCALVSRDNHGRYVGGSRGVTYAAVDVVVGDDFSCRKLESVALFEIGEVVEIVKRHLKRFVAACGDILRVFVAYAAPNLILRVVFKQDVAVLRELERHVGICKTDVEEQGFATFDCGYRDAFRIGKGEVCKAAFKFCIAFDTCRNAVIVCVHKHKISAEFGHVARLVFRPDVDKTHTCVQILQELESKICCVAVQSVARSHDVSVETEFFLNVDCALIVVFDVYIPIRQKFRQVLHRFDAVVNLESACVVGCRDSVVESEHNRQVVRGCKPVSQRRKFVVFKRGQIALFVFKQRNRRCDAVDEDFYAALPIVVDIFHGLLVYVNRIYRSILSAEHRERRYPLEKRRCGSGDSKRKRAVAAFVDSICDVDVYAVDIDRNIVADRHRSRTACRCDIVRYARNVAVALVVTHAVDHDCVHCAVCVLESERVAGETACGERKFESYVTRCPLAVFACKYGGLDAVFVKGVIDGIFRSVVVHLCVEGLDAALVACKVEDIESKSIISVSRHVVGYACRVALLTASVRLGNAVGKVVCERADFTIGNRIDACRLHCRIVCKLSDCDVVELGKTVLSVDRIEPNVRRITRRRIVLVDVDASVCNNFVLTEPCQIR